MTWGRYRVALDISQPFVVLDLETTGLKAHRHEIIEFAAIRFVPGCATHTAITSLVRPSRRLAPSIVRLTGITDAMIEENGVPARCAIENMIEFVGTSPLVAFNAAFDLAFLNRACETHSLSPTRKGHSCALALARKAWKGLPSYRLSALAQMLRLDCQDEHRALGDAKRATQVYLTAATCI